MSLMPWSLPAALRLDRPKQLVAFVGGGGKTSLMFALAVELPGRVVITTTTRIFAAQMQHAAAVLMADDLGGLGQLLDTHGSCLVIGRVDGDKALGVDPTLPGQWLARSYIDYVLVEADGARMRPIKAPAEHEPVVPSDTTLLVPVAGIDALSGPIMELAHRPERVLALLQATGRPSAQPTPDGRLTIAGMAELVASPFGGLKSAPSAVEIIPFINKVETAAEQESASGVAAEILRLSDRIDRVATGAVRTGQPIGAVHRRVGAIILAAGESRRMGQNKLLLPWHDATVLEQTVANVVASQASGSIIVSGHEAEVVSRLGGLHDSRLIHNPDFAEGMLSSVQTAVGQAPASWSAVLVVLGDQPMVSTETINRVLETYARSQAGLVVPRHGGQRGNPVLIDRRHFAELLALPPDAAPRLLLERYPDGIAWVDIADESVLHDLDRPEDYARWRPADTG